MDDVKVPIWFKDERGDVPVCYCANLTRDEIRRAVALGCTSIGEIRAVTGKTQTGQCRRKSPSGTCCHQAVQQVIQEALAQN